MLITNYFFSAAYPLLILSAFNAVILFAALIAVVAVTIGFYKSKATGYYNAMNGMQQQIADMQKHLEYASKEEAKARADAKRSAAAREKLLVSLTHEIRTPMNGILGMALLLEETSLAPDQKDYTETIISSGKILLNKVDEVIASDALEQIKIDRTINAAQQKPTDLCNCVEEVIDTLTAKAASRQIKLLYKIDTDVPAQVLTDNKRLQQVLTNLSDYIMETQAPPQVVVGVHIIKHNRTDTPPSLGFTVSAAITENALQAAALFTEGSSLKDDENTADEKILGVAISKKLVEEISGTLKTSKEIAGFIFCVPLTAATGKTSSQYSLKDLEDKKVLVVSSNVTATTVLSHQLKKWKMLPVAAANSKEALQLITNGEFNIVITENNLTADISGTALAAAINKTNPQLPVMLLNYTSIAGNKQSEAIAATLNLPLKQHVLFDALLSNLRQNKKTGNAQDMSVKKLTTAFASQYPLRILVAEDNDVNQKWAAKILSKMGYQPDFAENGHIALEMVGKAAYDLILMDVQMPEMDGLEATKMIRVCLNKQPVIIAMTANVMHGDRIACMQGGMDDYISKPVQLGELVNMLEKWALVIDEKRELESAGNG
jgi:CheY-like chemotaxis protein